ncbi:Protein CURVATURE THYLAKOID 1C like [Actinidia chinensis var. chinensis]|uniref:Protein CURVATURE THYLAKOID 1C like n=1 Tax=Actinidia chinensis var. chinensis TaxID=1590841 RepID=A0A2R6QZV4_ACTCC|nr:Protein CURVATURE THYLAKOID 1C like [Actinidia chinensis var. chinensis]
MASIVANLHLPVLVHGRQPVLRALGKFTVSATGLTGGRQDRVAIVTKATGESSESSTSRSIVKSVQNVWENSEDRFALIGLGFTSIVAIWASANLITAIDKLPIIPSAFEFVGILFSSWFIYRYLIFKPDREELVQTVNKSISDILGQ